jgi:hypothetical protein
MIDTIVLRFHEIGHFGAHERLAEFLNRQHTKTGKTVTMSPATANPTPVAVQQMFQTTLHYHDTGKVHHVAHFNELKSSHYTIAYKIDLDKNFVEINLSVPKYIFGTNILHYNRTSRSKNYFAAKHCELEVNLEESYKRLFNFLEKFFAQQFGTIELDYRLIEINRLDICYNQVFNCKDDALQYLNELKKLRKTNVRDSSNYSRGWKTSIVYKTQRYSFKVYHKGAEFKKNDAKKLFKINQDGKHKFIFPIEYYQRFADKILRYEMTLRHTQMSYLYMHKIFRADCYIWQAGLDLYKQDKQKKGNADLDAWRTFRAGLNEDEKKLLSYVNERVNKTKHFFLDVDSRSLRFDAETNERHVLRPQDKPEHFDYHGPFSRELWRLLTKQFLKVLDEYKLSARTDHTSLLAKVEAHNARVTSDRQKYLSLGGLKNSPRYEDLGSTVSESKIRLILQLLETQTFEEIADSNIFSRKTWYNHRKTLEQFGLAQTSRLSIAIRGNMDLRAYNSELEFNSSKFINLSF